MKSPQRATNRFAWILTTLTLVAFAFRTYQIGVQNLSGDEAFTVVNWTAGSLAALLNTIAKIDPQPPIALLTYYTWLKVVGTTEFASRMISALASIIAIPAISTLANQLFNKRVALLTALLAVFNPFQLALAQDVRPYALWVTLSLTSALYFVRLLNTPNPRQRSWLTYVFWTLASIFTFYLDAFFLVAQNLLVLGAIHTKTKRWRMTWIASQLTIALTVAAWYFAGNFMNSTYRPTAASPDLGAALSTVILADTFPYQTALPYVMLIVTLVALALISRQPQRQAALFVIAFTSIPIALLATLTIVSRQGFFRARYVAATSPYLLLMFAVAIYVSFIKVRRYSMSAIAVAAILIPSTISALNYHFNLSYAKAPTWTSLVAFLSAQALPNDVVIQNYPDPAFTYYYHSQTPTIVMPDTANPAASQVNPQLQNLVSPVDIIWFIPTPNPAWDKNQLVAMWLNSNLQQISEQWVGTFHVFQYGQWRPAPTAIINHTNIEFQNLATINGYDLTPRQSTYHPSDTLTIQLFITPMKQTPNNLTIFLHLLSPRQQPALITQDDHPPQHNRTTTKTWITDQLLRDVATITIQPNTKPGIYVLSVGFYDPSTSTRIPLAQNVQEAEPAGALLTTITIANP